MKEDSWVVIGNHKDYTDPETLLLYLQEHNIEYKVNRFRNTLDPLTHAGNEFLNAIQVLIPESELPFYRRTWEEEIKESLNKGTLDHDFLEMSEEDLVMVVDNDDDEWAWEDVTLAKAILANKGILVDEWKLEEKRQEKETESLKSNKAGNLILIAGFALILILIAFVLTQPFKFAVTV